MRQSLVIVASPRPGSFVHALAEAAASTLSEAGHEVRFHDLYVERFNPVLDPAEAATTRTADESAFTVGADPLTTRHRRELYTADTLVVAHPNWWGKPPAILASSPRASFEAGFASPAPSGSARRRGSIVFLTSGQGLGPLPGEIAYAAAKAAIAGVTLTISEELIDAGITVNTVNPGPVDTGYLTEEIRQATAAMFPQGRWGEPDDAARLITWLLTDEARWITGQVISSEGGFARWRR